MATIDSFLTDKHILNLYACPAKPQLTTMATNNSSLLYFLDSVPSPITLLLIDLAPVIHFVRRSAEIVSWKSHWIESWLVIAAWWYLCLTIYTTFRYLLPLFIILPSLLSYFPFFLAPRAPRLTTEQVLTTALSDIHAFRELLPSPQLPSCLIHVNLAIRISAILCIPYIFIIYLIPFPVIMGIVGTFVLSCRAPWAQALYSILTRSTYVRWTLSYVWHMLSNTKLETLAVMSATPRPAFPVRFLFTILECQRWWVGLDWTAALLPGERPSWCTVNYQAIAPPSVFVLPPATSVFLPGQNNNQRIKHTATWHWADPEWGVLVNKDGLGIKRVEKQPPGIMEEDEKDNTSSRLKKAATMLKDRTSAINNVQDKDKKEGEPSPLAAVPDAEGTHTDVDGWMYGDNKWEAPSAKGGLGKYTRFRRWTRVATLEESIEVVGPGLLGMVKDVVPSSSHMIRNAKSVIKDAYAMSDLNPRNSVSPSPSPGPSSSASSSIDTTKFLVEPTLSNSSSGNPVNSGYRPSIPVSPPRRLSNNLEKDNKLNQNDSKATDDLGSSFRERLKNVVRNTTRFE